MRIIWAVLGVISLLCGAIGAVLPLIPTVPFILLAAFSFARSSERMHRWLTTHPVFGPVIADWQTHGAVSPRAKRMATLGCAAVLVVSIISGVPQHVLLIQCVVLSSVLLFLWTRPNGPR